MIIIVNGIPNFAIENHSKIKNLVTAPISPPKKTAIIEDSIKFYFLKYSYHVAKIITKKTARV